MSTSFPGKRFLLGNGRGYFVAAGPQFRFILFLLLALVSYTLLLLVFQKLAGFLPFLVFLPIALISIFLFIGITGIVYSHKFVGPITRIRRAVDRLAEGDISISLRLRDSDDPMLKDLVKGITRLADYTRTSHTLIHDTAQDLFAEVSALLDKVRQGEDTAAVAKQIEIIRTKQELLDKAVQTSRMV
jgi:nitrogen fixation/metabolism regulation signal transduction histidine kinase